MTIHLTREQEQRIEAIIHSGAYQSLEDVMEAALTAVEQRAMPGFEGTEGELEALLTNGIDSAELPEEEFWNSVDQTTDSMLAKHKSSVRP
jgi:Arc/MetJ-type ribon-helix-helix transcriptional regulator